MNFATDSWFLAADQKSVELMSGHVRNVYNYLFSQVTENNCVFMYLIYIFILSNLI